MAGKIVGILQNFRALYPSVEPCLDAVKRVSASLNAGNDDARRTAVSPAGQLHLWNALPVGAAELLALAP